MEPRIWEGTPEGSLTMLKAIHLLMSRPPALWLKSRLVCLPMLNEVQVRTASGLFWTTVTVVWPADWDCVRDFTPVQPAGRVATPPVGRRPPMPSPLGTLERVWVGLLGLTPRL